MRRCQRSLTVSIWTHLFGEFGCTWKFADFIFLCVCSGFPLHISLFTPHYHVSHFKGALWSFLVNKQKLLFTFRSSSTQALVSHMYILIHCKMFAKWSFKYFRLCFSCWLVVVLRVFIWALQHVLNGGDQFLQDTFKMSLCLVIY